MIKLLVVDDSAFMRMAIAKMVEQDPGIQVVGEACNGEIAVQMAQQLRPNVITMDVEMPVMDGIKAVQRIMACAPCPIIMVSSLTTEGGAATIRALEFGAVDYIAKSSSFVQLDIVKIEKELQEKIYYWARHPINLTLRKTRSNTRSRAQEIVPLNARRRPHNLVDFVAVGVSTGGPRAVMDLLQSMGKLACPTVIAQHMPKEFTPGFAEHLALETGLDVVEGYHGMPLQPGQVVIAPGGFDSQVRKPFEGHYALDVRNHEHITLSPSADLLFQSVARTCKSPVAVILTGMGSDGTQGAGELSRRDFPVLAQEPATCVVDGMPGSAIAGKVVSEVLEIIEIGQRLQRWCVERQADVQSIGLN